MSLITQCPACATLFKVVPDQLRMSDGWVRCGQCDEVFDANENIRNDVAVADVPLQSTDKHAAVSPEPGMEDIANKVEEAALATPIPQEVTDREPSSEFHASADPILSKSAKELSDFSAAVSAASFQGHSGNGAVSHDEKTERRYTQMIAPEADAQADPKLSFMKPVRPPSVWTRRSIRAALAVICLGLSVLAVLQVVMHERNRLAVTYPEFRTQLTDLCAIFGLEIEPLRQIESVVIDSSAFSKVRNEVYKLSFTLRNTSDVALATPAMELTLTDMQDQVLMRKVLAASEFSNIPAVIGPGAEVSGALPLSVRSPISAERVSGYRLLAFYP